MIRIARFLLLMVLVFSIGCSSEHSGGDRVTSTEVSPGWSDYGAKLAPSISIRLFDDASAKVSPPADLLTEPSREQYDYVEETGFVAAMDSPLSTFSIDVDTASYSNVRRMIENGQLPPAGAVRIEELINYFDYRYATPIGEHPIAVSIDEARCPWNEEHRLVRVALKAAESHASERASCNLVFLVDVSGSMAAENKLPLVQDALRVLVRELRADDTVAIVTYAGNAGVALDATSCNRKDRIFRKIDSLTAGGGTNGAGGIHVAYKIAQENFIEDGINRVILCTDGDFNVGASSNSELVKLIQQRAESGVFLTVLGFGEGNFNDAMLEAIADKGNGNYAYIDRLSEARKVLSHQLSGTLETVAKDAKIQVDFNPAVVDSYRLIGFENRRLQNQDFVDDKKDAGDIGAGHRVTALYEVKMKQNDSQPKQLVQSEFVLTSLTKESESNTALTVRVRYKKPDESTSRELTERLESRIDAQPAKGDFRFAVAVAAFCMKLRDSDYLGDMRMDEIAKLAESSFAESSLLDSSHEQRRDFVSLVKAAESLARGSYHRHSPLSKIE